MNFIKSGMGKYNILQNILILWIYLNEYTNTKQKTIVQKYNNFFYS